MSNPYGDQPAWIFCRTCGYEWIVAFYPMPLGTFARCLKRATCARCGEIRKLYLRQTPPPGQGLLTIEEGNEGHETQGNQ